MSIPKQVEEAAQMAEELMASQNKTDVDEEIAEEVEENLEPEEEPFQPEEDEDIEEEVLEESDTQDEEEESFKRKYDSLKGKYDAEVPKLHKELRELKESVFERLGQVKPVEQESKEPAKPQVPEKVQEWMEEYGEDYVQGLNAYLDYMLEERLKDKISPVQQQVASVEEAQIKTAQGNFAAYLSDKVNGDWQKLWAGEDEGFKEFLQQPDPSGLYTYGDLVRLYNDNWDADRLAGVFNAYLGKAPVVEPPQKSPVKENRIAPNRRNAEPPKPKEQARIWTKDTIADFQAKDRRGEYSPEESQALWDDLLLAPSQNRIRN